MRQTKGVERTDHALSLCLTGRVGHKHSLARSAPVGQGCAAGNDPKHAQKDLKPCLLCHLPIWLLYGQLSSPLLRSELWLQ